ncbi:DNA glycosylase [Xylariaceae sp. FL0016]|nr:DNA glycosylase [Xylariaceae sp. FL0016]
MTRKTAIDSEAVEAPMPQEPSFKGRLQLRDFMFRSATPSASSPPRRSPRHPNLTSNSSSHPSNATTSPISPRPPQPQPPSLKRKASPSPSPPKTTTTKKRTRKPTTYAPPSTYAHLPLLPDALAPNLLILFIGLNPGLATARTGHAYAHPSNLFWKLLLSSGITPYPCGAADDRALPARLGLGFTNIVARPTRNGGELRNAELDAGVGALEAKCGVWRPEVVCVVGKSIWESIVRVWRGKGLAKGEFEYGWQEERMGAVPRRGAGGKRGIKEEEEEKGKDDAEGTPYDGARIFVATSTSGLAATVSREEKERIWKILGDWCVQRRKEKMEKGEDAMAVS